MRAATAAAVPIPSPTSKLSWRQSADLLLTYLRPQAGLVGILALLLLGSIALQLISPQIIRSFIDAASGGAPLDRLSRVAALFIGVALVQQALSVVATYFSERVGWSSTNALRRDLMLHCLRLDLGFHKTRTPGELIERIDGDVSALANFFSQFVVQVVSNLLLLAGVLVVLFRENWRVGLVMAIFSAVSLWIMNRTRGLAVPYWKEARQSFAELFGFIEERLAGAEDIRSSGAPAYVMRRLYGYTRERIRTGRKARVIGSISFGVPNVLFAAGTAMAFVLIAWLFGHGTMTLGTAFLIYSYTGLSFRPLRTISTQVEDFQKASAGIARIRDLLEIRSVLVDGPGAPFPPGPLAVEFDRVSFGYGEEEMVLKDLSFCLAPGTVLGLLGRTGSGKTTIARLLFRLYDAAAGTIRLGGADIRSARLADLRRHVGMVTQDVQLFRATVRQNVTFFDAGIDDARIQDALDALGLGEWCRRLPEGLDTMLGAGGTGLSAGEAQLLAFTRVFLKNPGLVILDEASSRLDPATERLIERVIDQLLRGRTGIVIAHRLATVQRVDEIMIMERGKVAEFGLRDELARDYSTRFSHLLRAGLETVLA